MHRQKRLILCYLKDAYEQFKAQHPGVQLCFSTFAMLRPKECVLAGASGTHTVCVCTLHQNTKLMFIGSKIATLSDGAFLHYRHCLAAIQCNPPSINCYLSKCKQCPGVAVLNQKLQDTVSLKKKWLIILSTNNGHLQITQPWRQLLNQWRNLLKLYLYGQLKSFNTMIL